MGDFISKLFERVKENLKVEQVKLALERIKPIIEIESNLFKCKQHILTTRETANYVETHSDKSKFFREEAINMQKVPQIDTRTRVDHASKWPYSVQGRFMAQEH